jgi:hypothetical protein
MLLHKRAPTGIISFRLGGALMRRYAIVRSAWDEEAKVWYVEESDIPGLATESPTLEGLKQRVRDILPDLLEETANVPDELDIEFIAYSHEKVRTAA